MGKKDKPKESIEEKDRKTLEAHRRECTAPPPCPICDEDWMFPER
jgi:hypothetical protein